MPAPAGSPPPHPGIVVAFAIIGAAVAGSTSYLSGGLSPVGVAVLAAAGALVTSCLSGWATATGNAAVWAVLLVVALVAGVWGYRDLRKGPEITGVVGFVGGCAPFRVYAQNRWLPYGAAIRSGPSLANKQISARDPNQSIEVNGWVHGDVAYPHNAKPFNSNIWFHLADGAGWVSFAGVREDPTFNDPTLLASGGTPAPTEPGCQGDSL